MGPAVGCEEERMLFGRWSTDAVDAGRGGDRAVQQLAERGRRQAFRPLRDTVHLDPQREARQLERP